MMKNENRAKEFSIQLQKKISNPRKSYLRKYQELVIGKNDLFSFIKYEAIVTFFGGVPGALGILLRNFFYKLLFYEVGKKVIFGKHINLTNPNKIIIGDNCIIGDYCELDAKYESGKIIIGNNVTIGRNTFIRTRDGRIKIGDDSVIGANCILVSRDAVLTIERNHLMAAYCYVSTSSHEYINKNIPINQQNIWSKDILIQKDVWIGARTTVLGGSVIKKGGVVGACSLVNHKIEEYCVVAGIPAKKIKSRI